MDYLSNRATLERLLTDGAEGFSENLIPRILTYQMQAQVEVIRLLESTLEGHRYPGNNLGMTRLSDLSYYPGYSPSAQRRHEARTLYEGLVKEEPGNRPRMLLERAEGVLCVHQALPTLALRPSAAGGLMKSVSKEGGNQLLSVGEMFAYSRLLYRQARQLISDALFDYGYEPVVCHAL